EGCTVSRTEGMGPEAFPIGRTEVRIGAAVQGVAAALAGGAAPRLAVLTPGGLLRGAEHALVDVDDDRAAPERTMVPSAALETHRDRRLAHGAIDVDDTAACLAEDPAEDVGVFERRIGGLDIDEKSGGEVRLVLEV